MTTIKDIANMAGVSTTTVSRVLNDYPDVSEKTKRKVIQIINKTNYKPNTIARSLSTRKSNTIGLFFNDYFNTGIHHPYFREIIYGFEKRLGTAGYDLLYFTDKKWGANVSYADKCRDRHIDGVILMGVQNSDADISDLLTSNIPTVFIDIDITAKNASYVISDNVSGAEKSVNYLYNLGHEKIAMIMGLGTIKPTKDRFYGYKKRLKELGLVFNTDWVFKGDYSEKAGYIAMKKIIKMKQITAVIAQSDVMAFGAMKAVEEAGLSIPLDYSIIGFDDIEISKYVKPALTTIRQKKVEMGEAASELLLKIIDGAGNSHSSIIVPVELIRRKSCKKLEK